MLRREQVIGPQSPSPSPPHHNNDQGIEKGYQSQQSPAAIGYHRAHLCFCPHGKPTCGGRSGCPVNVGQRPTLVPANHPLIKWWFGTFGYRLCPFVWMGPKGLKCIISTLTEVGGLFFVLFKHKLHSQDQIVIYFFTNYFSSVSFATNITILTKKTNQLS